MKPIPRHDDTRCTPVRRVLQAIGSKWSVLIVSHLKQGPMRFSDLKRSIGDITQKSLTASLRELEQNGLVERVVTPVIPPRVDYCLTPLGQTLLPPLEALTDWAIENEEAVSEARAAFQAAMDAPQGTSRNAVAAAG
ncbi:MAG: helix-turn-helix transcriptional regulator [Rhodobacteraceae bacterium]|nr:helix-turn-helix transcriptional regulator [Paracoccaceae bacterium]MBR9821002.1 helix-turn-helix transcriptional regulator [Paracoccaceae bacterium]